MRSLAALGLATLLACGGEAGAPQAVDVPAQTLDVPPIDAGAPTPAPVATNSSAPPPGDPPSAEVPRDAFANARDPVISQRKPRARATLVTEIQQLDNLLASTPATAPDRPMVMMRTAESHLELSRLQSGSQASDSRRTALKLYSDIASNYPKFGLRDEVLYYSGLAAEENGAFSDARKAYYEVIHSYPQSKYIPYAYFAFGEMFREESKSDPSKIDLAHQAYKEVLKYPQSPIRPFAKKRDDALPTP